MPRLLVATESDNLWNQVQNAVDDDTIAMTRVTSGSDVRGAVGEVRPDVAILDLQIGNMGGVATALDLRNEIGAGRLPATAIVLLLDRADDAFIAGASGADAWVTKPLNPRALNRTVRNLIPATTT